MTTNGGGKHVLLTGANGFVASHILAMLIQVRTLTIIPTTKLTDSARRTARVFRHGDRSVRGQSQSHHKYTPGMGRQDRVCGRQRFYSDRTFRCDLQAGQDSFWLCYSHRVSSAFQREGYSKGDDRACREGVRSSLKKYM
jgi:hypothetical protein